MLWRESSDSYGDKIQAMRADTLSLAAAKAVNYWSTNVSLLCI